MKEFDTRLNELFNITPINQKSFEVEKIEETNPDKKESDFDLARDTMRDLIAKNNAVLDDIISLARSSETARPFEVAGQLLKTQSEIAKGLVDLHKQKKDIDVDQPESIKTQNNIVFAGSTSELMKMISAEKAKTINIDAK
jgi:hypothetical protein